MRLLVGVDLSGSTGKIVKTAEGIAKALSAKVWILHVAEPEPDFVGFEPGPQQSAIRFLKNFMRSTGRYRKLQSDYARQA